MTAVAMVQELKETEQDFEWYPTTQEIIDIIDAEVIENYGEYNWETKKYDKANSVSILDCGAGDGRVLKALSHGGDMYAVEKAKSLIHKMGKEIFIVGTEFHETTLIDKQVKILFSNPPYSEYAQWAEKIILEANAEYIYLVLPERWRHHDGIQAALKAREIEEPKVLGGFDFLNADRTARAKVEVLSIKNCVGGYGHREKHVKTDPFTIWFEQTFAFEAERSSSTEEVDRVINESELKENLGKELVSGNGLIPALVELYNKELAHLSKSYSAIQSLDPELMRTLGVSTGQLCGALKQKLTGLKHLYWNEFFANYDTITDKLTSGSRKRMLALLQQHVNVDFTESNAYAVTVWAIKNANEYYDEQLITCVEGMIEQANVYLYKSNKRTFGDEDWRYISRRKELSKFALELRIVLHRVGGIGSDSFYYHNGLKVEAHNYLEDIMTVARNLGFDIFYEGPRGRDWASGKKQYFTMMNDEDLMEVKAFKNGNLHVKFNQEFIQALNVEFGRLKGWIKNPVQAAEEMDVPLEKAQEYFNGSFQLTAEDLPLLITA